MLICDSVLTKRYIANHSVHIAVRKDRFLEAPYTHIGNRVERLCNITRDRIKFHSRPRANGRDKIRRHCTDEPSYTGRRFQELTTIETDGL